MEKHLAISSGDHRVCGKTHEVSFGKFLARITPRVREEIGCEKDVDDLFGITRVCRERLHNEVFNTTKCLKILQSERDHPACAKED